VALRCAGHVVSGIMHGMNDARAARGHILATLFTCVVIALCHAACVRAVDPHDLHHPFIGKAAPEITAEPIGGEGPKTLAEALGKVVIVDFWASWCGPCKASFPIYQTILDKFPGDVAVIAVDTDEPGSKTKADLLAFAGQSHTRFSMVWDKDGSVMATYRARGLPSTFILDRSGTVRYMHAGYGAGYAQILTQEVGDLVNAAAGVRQAGPPPDGGHAGDAPPRVMSCELVPGGVGQFISDAHASAPAAFQRCALTPGCMSDKVRTFKCDQCLKASCCEETRACTKSAFAPGSPARSSASHCMCLYHCREGSWPFSECLGADRCGPAADPAADLYPALAACSDARCSDVCPKEHGGAL